MIARNPVIIPIRPADPARRRPALPPLNLNNPAVVRRITRSAAPPPPPDEAADDVVTTAFEGNNPTRPAQSRNRAALRGKPAPQARVRRDAQTALSVSSLATIYGCCGLFDMCSDRDLMSLSFQGADPFMDWIGWERTDVCQIKKNFIGYTRPEYSGQTPTAGYVSDPCTDPKGVDFGVCDFSLEDFARLRRWGPTRDITKQGIRLCESAPRWRLDGTPITDDREYDMRVTLEVILQDLKRMIVSGNATTAGQFDGLERLVKTGYTNTNGHFCSAMDSVVVNWNGGPLSSTAGVTWNGTALSTGFNFIDVLLAVYRQIRHRIDNSPVLSSQGLQTGDIVLVMPNSFIDCVLNYFTCWRVCSGSQYNETVMQSDVARRFRDGLNGGMFGAGRIFLHGQEIPILPYDWGLIKSPTRFDAYLLTGSIGNVKLLQGQYNDMNYAAGVRPDRYAVTDGGRILTYSQDDHTCEKRVVEMQPRILAWAPWAQARFQNLTCAGVAPLMSVDPTETSFYPLHSFNSAACP